MPSSGRFLGAQREALFSVLPLRTLSVQSMSVQKRCCFHSLDRLHTQCPNFRAFVPQMKMNCTSRPTDLYGDSFSTAGL